MNPSKEEFKQFFLGLACILSELTEYLCATPKAGYMRLGDVINVHRTVKANDIQSWIMIMQVWGACEDFCHNPIPTLR